MKLIFLWRVRTGFIKAKTWLPCQIVIELGSEILHEKYAIIRVCCAG